MAKSLALRVESVQPLLARTIAVALLGVGAGIWPSKQVAEPPYPTRSKMLRLVGQVPDNGVVVFTNATFPLVAARAIVPVASGVGRVTPFVPPDASWIK